MADPNQKQNDTKAAQPAQSQPAPAAQAEKREYVAKTKIVRGGRANRRIIAVGEALRLTDDEARKLGDAVELKRGSEAPR